MREAVLGRSVRLQETGDLQADQLAIGLKTSVDHLKKEVRELKGEKATVSLDTFNKLDSKVSALIRFNNLKTRE